MLPLLLPKLSFGEQGAGKPAQSKMASRITVRYEGRVQGVGFRYTAISLAQDFEVTGFVKNEFDGSVTLVAEGEEDELMGLLNAVRTSHLGRYITNELVKKSPKTGKFTGFGLKY